MGKSRKKKNQFKDFQKVKLKVGKTLPKGLNETVATFKSRSIQVKEQLKVDRIDHEPLTRRKLSLPDLLSQCQHYNTTVKHDALAGIKELLTAHPDLAQRNMAQILERCSELFMDKDPVVRQTVQKVLRLVFIEVSSIQIAPFFPILSAHLCCAMTHINDDIQQDSLVILDLCLENCPELVTASSNKIMPNFIEQISRQTQTSNSGKQGRSLLVNPSSKLSSQKWRNRVLERLQKFLRALLYQKNALCQDNPGLPNIHKFDKTKANDVQPLGTNSQYHNGWFSLKQCTQQTEEDGKVNVKKFVEVLVPLLLQCWIEAGPSQLATDLPGNCLSAEAMNTLWNVVSLLQLLLELIEKEKDSPSNTSITWFSKTYFKEMVQHFLPYFPYAMHEKPRQTKAGQGSKVKGQKEVLPQISVFTLNLSVCKVFSYFMGDSINLEVNSTDWQDKILEYMCEGLPGCRLNEEQLFLTVAVVEKVLHCTEDTDTVDSLLNVTFDIFKRCTDVVSKEAKALLRFFGDFSFGSNILNVQSVSVLKQWMASLPSLMWMLMETSSVAVDIDVATTLLHYLKSAGPLCEETFVNNLKTLLFERVFAIEDAGLDCLPQDLQKKLVGLVYWIPMLEIDGSCYQKLAQFCCNHFISQTVMQHVLDTLSMKYQRATTLEDSDVAEFLSFMLSLLIGNGCVKKSTNSLPPRDNLWKPVISCERLEESKLQHRVYLLQAVPEMLKHCQDGTILCNAVGQFISTYLTDGENHTVELLTAMGLLRLTAVISKIWGTSTADPWIKRNTTDINDVISSLLGAVVTHLVFTEPATCSKGTLTESGMEIDNHMGEEKDAINDVKGILCSLSPGLHSALWDILVEVLMDVPGLLESYVTKLKDRLSQGGDLDVHKFDIVGLTKLLMNKQVKQLCQHHRQLIQDVVTGVKSRSCDLMHNWWHQFKYEVSLL